MSAELQRQETLPTIETQSESVALMHIIERAATDPNMDVEKLQKLLDLKRQWDADQARKSFAAAMSDFQSECPLITKSKDADRYKYAPLHKIMEVIQPYLSKAGLSVSFSEGDHRDGWFTAICIVQHRDGHERVSPFSVPVDDQMRVNATQKQGSANSYACRYALRNALNLAFSDDDDGEAASTPMITDKQRIQLDEWIEALQIDVPKFCTAIKVPHLDAIPAAKWPLVERAVEAKRKAVEKE